MNLSIENIDIIYTELADATKAHDTAAAEIIANEADLKTLKAEAMAGGHIEGKNQAARDAAAREMFRDQHETLAQQKHALTSKRLRLDLAKIEVDRARMTLRLMELNA